MYKVTKAFGMYSLFFECSIQRILRGKKSSTSNYQINKSALCLQPNHNQANILEQQHACFKTSQNTSCHLHASGSADMQNVFNDALARPEYGRLYFGKQTSTFASALNSVNSTSSRQVNWRSHYRSIKAYYMRSITAACSEKSSETLHAAS